MQKREINAKLAPQPASAYSQQGRKSLPLRWIEVRRVRWFDPIA